MRPLAAIANERLLRLHFSQFRSLPIKNNTDAIVLPSPVVATQGRTALLPSAHRLRFQFCIERLQDFRALFFCNFPEPRLATAPVPAPRGSARKGALAAGRVRRGSIACLFVAPSEASEILLGFERFHCFAWRKISFRPRASNSTTFLRLPAAAHDQPRARVPDVVASRLPRPYHSSGADSIFSSRCGAISGRPRLAVSARNLSTGLGTDPGSKKSGKSATTADPPPCGSARREARVGRRAQALLGGGVSLTAWPWGYRVGETMKNPSISCVYQKEKSTFSLHRKRRPEAAPAPRYVASKSTRPL